MSEAMHAATAGDEAGGGGHLWIGFGLPLLLALLIHGVALLALLEGWSVSDESRFAPEVSVLEARLIELEAAAPAVVEVAAPAPATPAPARRETPATPRSEPAPVVAETPSPAVEAPPPEPVAEPRTDRISDFEDDALADLLAESLDAAIADEAARIGAARADAAVASFVGDIVRSIQRQWSRPPSARNGMEAELLIELVPTGELVTVEVLRGSSNAAFDRSALAAVRAAAPFQVPDDAALFEREFRRLRILFRPEDLTQ